MKQLLLASAIGIACTLAAVGTSIAQVAGSTVLGVSTTEFTQLTLGWSAKHSILGKTVYNEHGDKVGKVEDLIISPEKSVSYLIIGAGGFIGIGRHDVAIPAAQLHEIGGRIVLNGATKEAIKAMPSFDYASDTARRDRFVASAEYDIAQAKDKLAELQKKATSATGDAKANLDHQIAGIQQELKRVEAKLAAMVKAGANRWKEFERDVGKAMTRMRQSIDKATS